MMTFERKLPMEELDAAEILRGILKVQAEFAAAQNRPPGRGTHTKGVCARATLEVFDLSQKYPDTELAKRLAHGIFAKPGVYQATVRFANAASTIYPDRKPDLRALSFSVQLPPELAGQSPYQDYSLQTAPTFPINDAHTFAVLIKVLSAGSRKNKAKALLSLSLLDMLRVLRAMALGVIQSAGKIQAYQKFRYWSTVPFRNGPLDAAMFSAAPSEDNPALAIADEPNSMRDELIRHLNEDERMSSWDFGVQLLEPSKMTRWGFHRAASFWVENATVKWKESQAPFYTVGRLKLVPKSAMELSACEPQYIDVTEHSTADSQPLGSINRARWTAEIASRKVRRGEATAEQLLDSLPYAPPVHRSLLENIARFGGLAFACLLLLYFAAGVFYRIVDHFEVLPAEQISDTRYLDQGWGLDRASLNRELYYYTAQGSGIHDVRYSWFANLERPFRRQRLADPDHMRSLNFIVDPAPTKANADHLPVGFARRYEPTLHDDVVDVTCAVCHTGQINIKDKSTGKISAVRIDGGQSMAAFTDVRVGSFEIELVFSLGETLTNPFKFNRFANRVLGPNSNTVWNKVMLWGNVAGVNWEILKRIFGSSSPLRYPTREGYGRTDALTRIGNVVFGDHVSRKNYHVGNAPVSYPYLWDIWKFDWVQYDASVSEPLARNVSEALGVGAKFQFVDDYGRPIPEGQRYQSSVAFENLTRIEATLQMLKAPRWDDPQLKKILPAIDPDRVKRGEKLFNDHCVRCHGPHIAPKEMIEYVSPGRLSNDPNKLDDPLWIVRGVKKDEIGTDPTEVDNFSKYTVDLTNTGITMSDIIKMLKMEKDTQADRYTELRKYLDKQVPMMQQEQKDQKLPEAEQVLLQEYEWLQDYPVNDASIAADLNGLDIRSLNAGDALNIVGMLLRQKFYRDNHIDYDSNGEIGGKVHGCFAGFDTLDIPHVDEVYKPRPLEGVWATPPFLHNGSVPTLYDLLSPVEDRPKGFWLGSRDFDIDKVGYVNKKPETGGFWFDVGKKGNHNTGHEFRNLKPGEPTAGVIGPFLSPDDRMDIIEYLKRYQNPPESGAQTPPSSDSPAHEERKPPDCIAMIQMRISGD